MKEQYALKVPWMVESKRRFIFGLQGWDPITRVIQLHHRTGQTLINTSARLKIRGNVRYHVLVGYCLLGWVILLIHRTLILFPSF